MSNSNILPAKELRLKEIEDNKLLAIELRVKIKQLKKDLRKEQKSGTAANIADFKEKIKESELELENAEFDAESGERKLKNGIYLNWHDIDNIEKMDISIADKIKLANEYLTNKYYRIDENEKEQLIDLQKKLIDSLSQPVTQPVVQPIVQPVVQPVVQSVVQPAVQPVVQPVVQPAVQYTESDFQIPNLKEDHDISINTKIFEQLIEDLNKIHKDLSILKTNQVKQEKLIKKELKPMSVNKENIKPLSWKELVKKHKGNFKLAKAEKDSYSNPVAKSVAKPVAKPVAKSVAKPEVRLSWMELVKAYGIKKAKEIKDSYSKQPIAAKPVPKLLSLEDYFEIPDKKYDKSILEKQNKLEKDKGKVDEDKVNEELIKKQNEEIVKIQEKQTAKNNDFVIMKKGDYQCRLCKFNVDIKTKMLRHLNTDKHLYASRHYNFPNRENLYKLIISFKGKMINLQNILNLLKEKKDKKKIDKKDQKQIDDSVELYNKISVFHNILAKEFNKDKQLNHITYTNWQMLNGTPYELTQKYIAKKRKEYEEEIVSKDDKKEKKTATNITAQATEKKPKKSKEKPKEESKEEPKEEPEEEPKEEPEEEPEGELDMNKLFAIHPDDKIEKGKEELIANSKLQIIIKFVKFLVRNNIIDFMRQFIDFTDDDINISYDKIKNINNMDYDKSTKIYIITTIYENIYEKLPFIQDYLEMKNIQFIRKYIED